MRTKTKHLTNKKMNDETYALRRKVIDIIYTLKQHVDLPRITVRITDTHPKYLGMGTMDGNITIWITEEGVKLNPNALLHLVAHEIGHAVFKLSHKDECPLMKQGLSVSNPANIETIVAVLNQAKR